MAEEVARIATPEDEADWLARAERMTVREMLATVKAALASRGESPGERAEELVALSLKVDQEDAWIWQATKTLMEVALDTPGLDEQAGALISARQ